MAVFDPLPRQFRRKNKVPPGLLCNCTKSRLDGVAACGFMVAMNIKVFSFGLICAGGLLLTGCVNTIDGRSAVGVPLVKDTMSRRYERPTLELWAAAKDVLKADGALYSEDTLRSTLEASVDTKTVWVKVEPVDQRVTKVTVQVRTKSGAPDLDLAGEIHTEIAVRLVTGNITPATKAATAN